MGKSARRKEDGTETGVDIAQPAVQASVVAGNAVSGSKFPIGTVGELRDRLQQYCIKTKRTYQLYLPESLPPFILQKPLDQLEKGEMYYLGSFGEVKAYAQQGQGFFTTESERKSDIEDLCEFITRDLKAPKAITLHFATRTTDKIVEEWCKKNGVELKRKYENPNPKPNPNPEKKPPEQDPASVTLPKLKQ
ncbi:MAG: hypothetical protein SFW07_01335 [Gammaproteobacteria bacterium]|nr:hypothetical protein [Gammaproteobacteria bacterium]